MPPVDQPRRALAVLLLPRTLEQFILRDQAQDLLRAPNVVAVEPARVPYGAYGRLPSALADGLAAVQGRRIRRALRGARLRVVVMFHAIQYPLARALVAESEDAELWYGRWDRYEEAYDADPRMRARLAEYHRLAAERASLVFTASAHLAELEREAGREAQMIGLAADSFPAPDPTAPLIAVCLGHLGRRTDWALLRGVAERMPELVLLLVGAWHDDEVPGDEDYAWCRRAPNLVWLGAQPDEEAARLILCADVGIVPFKVEPFNDAGLPYRILKYARLGRLSVTTPLRGAQTWERAVIAADGPAAWVDALRSQAGRRMQPDLELRRWALEQTAEQVNEPLWERLEALGVLDPEPGRQTI